MSIDHHATGPMTVREHVGLGIAYGYPLCCVLRWVWGWKRGEGAQASDRGTCAVPRPGARYVVCGIFHKACRR